LLKFDKVSDLFEILIIPLSGTCLRATYKVRDEFGGLLWKNY